MDKNISGIYCITNIINGHQYVGLSKDCLHRWYDHYSKSYCSTRADDLKKVLYIAMRKYGRENFLFQILEECPIDKLKEREIYWIAKLDTYHHGYNETPGGDNTNLTNVLKGESHGMSRLTQAEVIQCRKWYQEGKKSRYIWTTYFHDKITYSGFQRMWHGKTWKHVMPEVFLNNPHPKVKYNDKLKEEIRMMYNNGKTCAEIYHYYNETISRTSINYICHNKQ